MIYKKLSADMRDGLKNIYQQISSVSEENCSQPRSTNALFSEASSQLDEVVKATESAAMNIMEIVENQLDLAEKSGEIIDRLKNKLGDDPDWEKLREINSQLQSDLTTVLTTLSFQDITGQRIAKVLSALNAIEKSVVELYLASGLVMEAAEKDPSIDADAVQAEAKKVVEEFCESKKTDSKLKGPDNKVTQSSIDDMLSQLGL